MDLLLLEKFKKIGYIFLINGEVGLYEATKGYSQDHLEDLILQQFTFPQGIKKNV